MEDFMVAAGEGWGGCASGEKVQTRRITEGRR